jgi:hypothetical protein
MTGVLMSLRLKLKLSKRSLSSTMTGRKRRTTKSGKSPTFPMKEKLHASMQINVTSGLLDCLVHQVKPFF